ncbi:Oxidoreductase P35 [subsurface metagenome]
MIDASIEYDLPASAAHYRRELPLFNKIKNLLDAGSIGQVLFITIQTFQTPQNDLVADSDENWRIVPTISGGGIFHDLAPHQLDLMYWYFGIPVRMNGFSTNQGSNYDAPDLTRFEAFFEKNIYLNGFWSFAVHKSADIECCTIVGEKGKLSFSFFRSPVLELNTDKGIEHFEFSFPENIQQPMIDKVVRFFRGEGENPCSLEDALQSIKMMDCTL